jgi:predicted DCC family thiol-disulfide oxidoreductase YuxK
MTLPWRLFYYPLRIVPETVRDWGYGVIGRNRYRLFGKAPQECNKCKFE